MSEYEPFDALDQERTDATTAEEERLEREKQASDTHWVMSSKQGRRFIHRQLSDAGVWQSTFDTDPAVMAFKEGNRNRGLALLAELNDTCPDRYLQMLDEQRESREKNGHKRADRRNRNSGSSR